MKNFIQNIKNSIDFFLRQRLTFSRKNYYEKNEPKEGLFDSNSPKAQEKEEFLYEKYGLKDLKNNSTRRNYLENLYVIDVLDKYFDLNSTQSTKILDVGCKNWFYAKGEYFFFKKCSPQFELDGIELDSKRLYSNLFTRAEAAKFYIKGLQNTTYIEGDFLNHNVQYDCITWFLPFIIKEPMLKWGLPTQYFKPEVMLEHAYKMLNQGGKMLIVNQGETEFEVQKQLCDKLNIKYIPLGEIKSDFELYKPRFGMIIEK